MAKSTVHGSLCWHPVRVQRWLKSCPQPYGSWYSTDSGSIAYTWALPASIARNPSSSIHGSAVPPSDKLCGHRAVPLQAVETLGSQKSGTCGGLENIRVFHCTCCLPKSQVVPMVMRDIFKELQFSKIKKQKSKEPRTKGSHNRINLRLNTVLQEDIRQSLDVSCPWKGLGFWKPVFGHRKLLENLTADAISREVSEEFEK